MTSRKHLALAAAAALALGSFSFAQQREPGAGAGAGGQYSAQGTAGGAESEQQMTQQLQQIAQDPKTAADKLFVLHLNHESLFCQQISQQVAQKAQNEEVKKLAQRLVQDEKQTQQKLATAAQSLGIQLPQSLSPKEQQIIQTYSSIPADQLEKVYTANAQAGSARNILLLQSCAQISQNDDVKQFAQQMLPMCQQSHQQAMAAAQAVGIPGGMEAITAGARIPADSGATESGGTGTKR